MDKTFHIETPRWITAALLLPVMIHVAFFGSTVIGNGTIPFGLTDFVIFLALIMYLGIALLAVRERKYAIPVTMVAYSILLSVVAAEAVLRFLVPPSPENIPLRPMKRVSQASDAMPGISGGISWSINSLGLRGPEVDMEGVRHRILAVGGSTTECFYVTDEKTWTWRLQDQLSEALGETVFVGNAGRGGHFTLHHEYLLRHYPLAERFEWVVVLAGINDLGRLLRNDYRERLYWIPEEALPQHSKLPYYRKSVIYRLVKAYLQGDTVVQDPEGNWIAEKRIVRRKALSQDPVSRPPAGLEEALAIYRENLRRIITVCRERSQKVVMLTQPTLYRKDMPKALRKLLWAHVNEQTAYTEEALDFLVSAYNRAMIEVCRDEGVDCIDLASLLPKDTSVFYDDCHFNISGCEQIANILARYFTDKLTGKPHVKTAGVAREEGSL